MFIVNYHKENTTNATRHLEKSQKKIFEDFKKELVVHPPVIARILRIQKMKTNLTKYKL